MCFLLGYVLPKKQQTPVFCEQQHEPANKTSGGRAHSTMNLWKLNRAKGREEKEVYILIQVLPLPALLSEHTARKAL